MAKADAIRRLGISPLARLRLQGPRRGQGAAVRPRGCDEPGDRPAPKAPNSPERWYFCEAHAAEYNKNWNYFAGLDRRGSGRARGRGRAPAPRPSASPRHWQWGGPGDGTRSRDEMRALDVLELETDADFKAVKAAYRRLAKEHHPDLKPGDKEAAEALPAGPGGLRSAAQAPKSGRSGKVA